MYRWDNVLPGPDEIHEAITEAVTGIISLDNTLVVARHFEALPATVVVVEIEPDAHEFGSSLTPAVDAALVEAREAVTSWLWNRPPRQLCQRDRWPPRARHTGVVFGQVIDGSSRIH